MKIRMWYTRVRKTAACLEKNKLFHTIGQKPMYLHLLDRLAAVAERHRELEIVVVSQYEELLQEAAGEGPGPIRGPSVEKERRAPFCRLRPFVSCIQSPEPGGSISQHPGRDPGGNAEIQSALWNVQAGGRARAYAYVFFVADQPWLSERTVETFLEFMKKVSDGDRESRPIGCVSRLGEPGNPVWFSAFYKDELLALSGDRGGKRAAHESPYGPGTFF